MYSRECDEFHWVGRHIVTINWQKSLVDEETIVSIIWKKAKESKKEIAVLIRMLALNHWNQMYTWDAQWFDFITCSWEWILQFRAGWWVSSAADWKKHIKKIICSKKKTADSSSVPQLKQNALQGWHRAKIYTVVNDSRNDCAPNTKADEEGVRRDPYFDKTISWTANSWSVVWVKKKTPPL